MGQASSHPEPRPNPSQTRADHVPAEVDPDNHYAILGLDQGTNPTDTEIRKAYRRLALIHHPDRLPSHSSHPSHPSHSSFPGDSTNPEDQGKAFIAIQTAYEVLSDPHERAYYDSELARARTSVAAVDVHAPRTDEELAAYLRSEGGKNGYDPGLQTVDIKRFLDPDALLGRSMEDQWDVYGALFRSLAAEERLARPHPLDPPLPPPTTTYSPLGGLDQPWRPMPEEVKDGRKGQKEEKGAEGAEGFYAAWQGFRSRKSFIWVEHHDPSMLDRRLRRALEKENTRQREMASRAYNEAVRDLLAFVRRRDPRRLAHAKVEDAHRREKQVRMKERQETERRQARERLTKMKASDAPSEQDALAAAQGEAIPINPSFQPQENGHGDEEVSEEEADCWSCVACNKLFYSLGAWGSHENSKKHKMAVKKLIEEMREEDAALADSALGKDDMHNLRDNPAQQAEAGTEDQISDSGSERSVLVGLDTISLNNGSDSVVGSSDGDATDAELLDDCSQDEVGAEGSVDINSGGTTSPTQEGESLMQDEDGEPATKTPELSKREKRRLREAAKKASDQPVASGDTPGTAASCNVCRSTFSSRTKLFEHIKRTKHAAAVPKTTRKTRKQAAKAETEKKWSDDEDGPKKGKRKAKR